MIKLADTLTPMADFPAAMAENIAFGDGESLQEKYNNGGLGGSGSGENKINSISVNGSPVSIDENKNVDIAVPSIEGLATESYVTEQINIQQSTVKNLSNQLDDVVATVEGHTTSINTLQTSIGEKANSADVYTKDQVDNKVSSSVASVYKYKGNVASLSDLNDIESPENGDVYFVAEDSLNYVYTDGNWNPLAGIIDLSDYVTDSDMTNALAGKANTTDIKTKTSQLENDSGFATQTEVEVMLSNTIPEPENKDKLLISVENAETSELEWSQVDKSEVGEVAFKGTEEEWNALSDEEKGKFQTVIFTDKDTIAKGYLKGELIGTSLYITIL